MNSPALLRQTIKAVYEKGSALEYEVVEASSLHRLLRYAEEGLFDRDREQYLAAARWRFRRHASRRAQRAVRHR